MNFAYETQPQTLYPPVVRPPRDVVGPPVELVRIGGPDARAFRLGKINEIEVLLRTEVAERKHLAKKRTHTAAICDSVAGGAETSGESAKGLTGFSYSRVDVGIDVHVGGQCATEVTEFLCDRKGSLPSQNYRWKA